MIEKEKKLEEKKMKCTHCDSVVRVSKEKYLKQEKLCLKCYRLWKRIGKKMGTFTY